jgi:hypothetical protein
VSESPDYHHIGDHSETILIEFDPQRVSYAQLLEIFWESHDPGYDVYSRQYRNAIFYLNGKQRETAEASREEIAGASRGGIYSVVEPAGEFYTAEDYHQKYLLRKATGIFRELQTIYPDVESFTASTAAAHINGYLGCNGEREELERELDQLGLSRKMQERLVEHVAFSCDSFAGLTCPAPK